MDLILRLRVGRAAHQLFFVCVMHRFHERAVGEERSAKIFHHHRTRNHPKELITNCANYEARLPDRPVKTSHTTCRQGHDQQSDRTETSIFCLQNDATVRRTVTTFVCPQTQFHENLHTNFALQNLPILVYGTQKEHQRAGCPHRNKQVPAQQVPDLPDCAQHHANPNEQWAEAH